MYIKTVAYVRFMNVLGFFSTGDESLAEIYAWEEDEIIMDSFVILLS